MQSKGVVRFFLIALTIVCLYQYLLVIPTNNIESDARAHADNCAGSNPKLGWQGCYAQYLDSLSTETVFEIPLIKKFTYADLKKSQLAMGLDLKGGMSVLLQVDLRDFLVSLSGNSTDPNFIKALDRAKELQKSQQGDYITLFAQAWKELGEGRSLASIFARNEASTIKFDAPDADALNTIRNLANGTVDETYKRLKQRIDKLGVVQPNVSLDAARDLIQVELPGIDNPARAREMLTGQAKLEFWETYRIQDEGVIQGFTEADKLLKANAATASGQIIEKDTTYEFPKGADGKPDSTKEKIPVITDRLNIDSVAGPLISKMSLNGQGGSVLAWVDKNKMETVMEYLTRPEVAAKFPADMAFRWGRKPVDDAQGTTEGLNGKFELYAVKKRPGSDKAPLDGSVVTVARADPDPTTGEIQVSLQMNNDGAKIWADMTTKAANAGNREVAILLDDEVVSAPRVINPITGGSTSITGGFTLEEAQDLAQILQVGKLPAGTTIVQESQVGPSLGADNINKSLVTMALSVLFLCFFMVAYYNKGGWVSVVALLANIFFILGTLASMGTVLTLPGIAGIVLTLAAAVDANVIIYERIREELRNGLTMAKAVSTGFTRALTAIIDANATMILTALVLMYFGLGPIKGFGTVLLIGIICSMFTAVLVGRYITEWWLEKGRDINYSRPWSESWLVGFHYDWIGKRKIAYAISLAIIAIGVASFFMRGFELGVDFKGGYSFNVAFDKPVDIEQLRGPLTTAFGGNPVIKAVNTANTYNITTSYLIEEQGQDVVDRVATKMHEGITAAGYSSDLESFKKTNSSGTHIVSSSQVSATVADDIRNSSFKAGFWALGLIFLFLLIRFRRWQFSLGAVLSLAHDALIMLTFFSLLHGIVPFSLEIDQAIIACILTVIGFSVNDTVIVYDRIREFMHIYTGRKKEDVFNLAINTTLSRTLITSGTILVVVLLLFIFGGSAIRGFAFGMLVGILFGTYSSIFVASALVVDFTKEDVISGKSVEAAPAEKPAKEKKEKA
ncbi:MAG TPA: protein translocase subunit SecDF [Saprospiraceae bacterium]|nr:protein translocase subunit SecDF [Saprospiraceae bacterium]